MKEVLFFLCCWCCCLNGRIESRPHLSLSLFLSLSLSLSLRCNLSTATQRQALTLCLVLSRCCVGGGEGEKGKKEGRKGDGRGRRWAGLRTRTASGLHVFAGNGGLYPVIVTPGIRINVFSNLHHKHPVFSFSFWRIFAHLAKYFLRNFIYISYRKFLYFSFFLNQHKSP
jgi:hypothetical protein